MIGQSIQKINNKLYIEQFPTGILTKKRTLIMTRQGKLTVWLNKLFPVLTDSLVFKHFTKEKNALIKL
jgi:hypothetical protein